MILRGKDKNNTKQEIINLAVSSFVFLSTSIRLNQLLNRSLQLIKIQINFCSLSFGKCFKNIDRDRNSYLKSKKLVY